MSSLCWPLFVAIFMTHGNGDNKRQTKEHHVQGMLDELDPLIVESLPYLASGFFLYALIGDPIECLLAGDRLSSSLRSLF